MIKPKQHIKNGEGENYNYAQDHCFVKLSSRDTNGELCLIEDTLKPGFHLKRHHHKVMTEVFYMLVGEMELIFDDEKQSTYRFQGAFGYKFSERSLLNFYGTHSNIASATAAGFTFTEVGLRFKWQFLNRAVFRK